MRSAFILILLSAFSASFTSCASVPKIVDASKRGDIQVVKTLLAKGADVNAKTKYGGTALIFASQNSHSEVVNALLAQQGVKVNIKSNTGKTALDYAGNDLIRGLLKAAGGKTGQDI